MIHPRFLCTALSAVLAVSFLTGCETDEVDCPTTPCPSTDYFIAIDIQPDWVDAAWTLTAGADSIVGVGDTVLVFDSARACTLRTTEFDGLVVPGGPERILAPAEGDTLQASLRYVQQGWQRRIPHFAASSFSSALVGPGGDMILAGSVDQEPLLQRRNHAGEVVWSVVQPSIGQSSYCCLLPLEPEAPEGVPAFVAIESGLHTTLSWRTNTGNELSSVRVDSLSFSGITGDPGQWILLGTGTNPDRVYTALVEVSGSGEVSRTIIEGDSHCVGVGVAPRLDGGWWVVQTRDVGHDAGIYDIELLAFDDELHLDTTRKIAEGEGGHGLGMITRPDGGLYVNYLSHDLVVDDPGTIVVAISASGFVEWSRSLEERGFEDTCPLLVRPDGGATMIGAVTNYGDDEYCLRLVQLSVDGSFADSQRLCSLPSHSALNGGCALWDEGLLLCGSYGDQQDGFLVRLASPELGGFGWPDPLKD